jgi:hypothetical protein
VDGITLVQRYIRAPEPFITRVEFVGGRFFYAVRVDTSQGFELCPADACQVDGAAAGACPAEGLGDKFQILREFDHPLIPRWGAVLAANGIGRDATILCRTRWRVKAHDVLSRKHLPAPRLAPRYRPFSRAMLYLRPK